MGASQVEKAQRIGIAQGFQAEFLSECFRRRAHRLASASGFERKALVSRVDDFSDSTPSFLLGVLANSPGTRLAPTLVVRILPWRPPRSKNREVEQILARAVGQYAGRAVYRPLGYAWLNPSLSHAVGKEVEVQFEGIASADELFAGQALYRERQPQRFEAGWLIPEQDLQFLD